MPVNSDTSPSVPRLDDETEYRITRAVYSGCPCMIPGECRYCTANVDALRSRIRTLIEEALREGFEDGRETSEAPNV